MTHTEAGWRCPTCDGFMSDDAKGFHSCTVHVALKKLPRFFGAGVDEGVQARKTRGRFWFDGTTWASSMDDRGDMMESERLAA